MNLSHFKNKQVTESEHLSNRGKKTYLQVNKFLWIFWRAVDRI